MPTAETQDAVRHQRHYEDISFLVVAYVHDGYVDYEVYDTKDDVENASDIFLHGSVKWDGCSNWYFDMQDHVMLHGCDRSDVLRFGEVMAKCWDWASEICPNWDGG